MQAIVTRFLGPTNTKGSRISASFGDSRAFVPYDHSMSAYKNYEQAALEMLKKQCLDDKYSLIGGNIKGNTYAFVLLEKDWKP